MKEERFHPDSFNEKERILVNQKTNDHRNKRRGEYD